MTRAVNKYGATQFRFKLMEETPMAFHVWTSNYNTTSWGQLHIMWIRTASGSDPND